MFLANLGETSIVCVDICSFFGDCFTTVSYETCRTSLSGRVGAWSDFVASPVSPADSSVVPESVLWANSDLMIPPSRASNRAKRLICRREPPTSSHGSQKLYDGPNLDLL